MNIASNENFKVNGLKLYYCETWKDLQDLEEMSLPEAKALMHNIKIYKEEGVPEHLLDVIGDRSNSFQVVNLSTRHIFRACMQLTL